MHDFAKLLNQEQVERIHEASLEIRMNGEQIESLSESVVTHLARAVERIEPRDDMARPLDRVANQPQARARPLPTLQPQPSRLVAPWPCADRPFDNVRGPSTARGTFPLPATHRPLWWPAPRQRQAVRHVLPGCLAWRARQRRCAIAHE